MGAGAHCTSSLAPLSPASRRLPLCVRASHSPSRLLSVWQEAHLDECSDELYAFYTDPEHRAPGCCYGHRVGVCKCHCPLWHEGQDETIFKEFAYSSKQWIIRGLRSVRKKSDGRGRHLSGTQSELLGVGFPLTAAELEIVNSFRARRGRPPLDCSPGMRFLDFGKNKDGYLDYEKFLQQVTSQ